MSSQSSPRTPWPSAYGSGGGASSTSTPARSGGGPAASTPSSPGEAFVNAVAAQVADNPETAARLRLGGYEYNLRQKRERRAGQLREAIAERKRQLEPFVAEKKDAFARYAAEVKRGPVPGASAVEELERVVWAFEDAVSLQRTPDAVFQALFRTNPDAAERYLAMARDPVTSDVGSLPCFVLELKPGAEEMLGQWMRDRGLDGSANWDVPRVVAGTDVPHESCCTP
ncbi:hypothetical protein DFJ74DRAFT_673093 [Hyaloraphidium curvatum]|nr:hypothetical protein DFJ74DRAFT_673093 [Hyaloraphidium curvatum]